MKLIGADLEAVMKDRRSANPDAPGPVHLVVPDEATADVLTSIADNLAGVELSRLRWKRDREMGRPTLTFNGEPARVPRALSEQARLGVSFLLEEDRARALTLRSPIVDARAALGRHFVAGGPAVSELRLDYLAGWASSDEKRPLDHRAFGDQIEAEEHTPGARLTNRRSDALHAAFAGTRDKRTRARPAKPREYSRLARDELAYKTKVMDKALEALSSRRESNLREVYRAIEGDAQAIWRRRQELHASDLVRFGRTYRFWRNALVPTIESDATCGAQLLALTNPQAATDTAQDAGSRDIATALVIATDPLTVEVDSRRIGDETRIVLLHVNDFPCVEEDHIEVASLKGGFRIDGLSIGPLSELEGAKRRFTWSPEREPELEVGDRLIVANFSWFGSQVGNKVLPVDRPIPDKTSAPKTDCTPESYDENPRAHRWCCRPHEVSEAEWSDTLAERRKRGELNPEAWPPVIDTDAFEVAPLGLPSGDPEASRAEPVPDDVTADDLG
jgi:hypothetical protein